MSSDTFHQFKLLPRELQISIFKEAAHVDRSIIPEYLDIDRWFFFSYFSCLVLIKEYLTRLYPTVNFDTLNHRLKGGYMPEYVTRLRLTKTNVLARHVAMESWRKDLVDVTPEKDLRRNVEIIFWDMLEEEDNGWVREEFREEMVEWVDAVLEMRRESLREEGGAHDC